MAEDAIQGHRLQALLAFQQHYVANTVAAQVIGTSGSDLSRVLYIDKGSADGLKPDQAATLCVALRGSVQFLSHFQFGLSGSQTGLRQ